MSLHPTTTRRPTATTLLALAALLAGLLAVGGTGPAAADGDEAPNSPSAFERLTVGRGVVCVVSDAGTLRCWGNNANGQLGVGDTENRGDEPDEMGARLTAVDLGAGRTATAVSASDNSFGHTCAILDNARLRC